MSDKHSRIDEKSNETNNEKQFILHRAEQGFVFRNQFFSTKLKNEFKLTSKQYYAIQHLYDDPNMKIYSKDLKWMIEDSLGEPIQKNTSAKKEMVQGINNPRADEEVVNTALDRAIERSLSNDYPPENHQSNMSLENRPAGELLDEAFIDELIASLKAKVKKSPEKTVPTALETPNEQMTEAEAQKRYNKMMLGYAYQEYKDAELLNGNKKILSRKNWEKDLTRMNLERSKRNLNTHYRKKGKKLRGGKVVVTLPNSISYYFIRSKKLAVANLFGSLIKSTGHSGYYYLNI